MFPRLISWLTVLTLTAIGLLVASAAAHPLAPSADNLLQNPSFESGLSPWYACGGEVVLANQTAHNGSWSAKLSRTSGTGESAVCQTVQVTPLASYSASGWFFLDANSITSPAVQLAWQTSAGPIIEHIPLADCPVRSWCQRTASAQAPANAQSVQIRVRAFIGDATFLAYADDISLIQTAPPPTQTGTPTITPTRSPTPTVTATQPPTPTRSRTATQPPLPTATPSRTHTPSATPTATGTSLPAVTVLINEVEYNSNHTDSEAYYEWLELYNPSGQPATLNGWTVRDNSSTDTLPNLTIPAGGFAVVAARRASFLENYPVFNGILVELGQPIGNGLANTGDRLLLFDASGRLVGALSYGDDTSVFSPAMPSVAAKGHSIERWPLGRDTASAGDFLENPHPSPGQAWSGPPPTATPSATATAAATDTPTATPSATATATDTPSATPSATVIATATDMPTATLSATATVADIPIATPSETATATATDTPTATPSATATATSAPSATVTATATDTATPSATATAASTLTATPSARATVRWVVFLPLIMRDPPPTPTPTATPNPRLVRLNEILAKPVVIDWNGDGKVDSGDEWVEIYNAADVAVDVGGWALDDAEDGGSQIYFLPMGATIAPHGFLLLFGKQTGLNYANTKDVVRLLYRTGEVMEEYRYYATWPDRSFSKTVDGGSVWTMWYPPSPGQPNMP